jgi:hypothetical protein
MTGQKAFHGQDQEDHDRVLSRGVLKAGLDMSANPTAYDERSD